jgi:hypothetical protein
LIVRELFNSGFSSHRISSRAQRPDR